MKIVSILLVSALAHLASAGPTPATPPKFGRFRMKDEKALEFSESGSKAFSLNAGGEIRYIGEPVVTYNASSGYVDGKSTTYTYQTGTNKFEKVTTFVIEGTVAADDIDQLIYENEKKLVGRMTKDISIPYNVLEERQYWDWVCHYTYGCVEGVVYYVTISAGAMNSVRRQFQDYLRRDNYQVLRYAGNTIKEFAVGVAADQFSGFITNKVQQQNTNAINSCNNDELERKVQQLTDDLNFFMNELRQQRQNGCKCNHFSENDKTKQDGENLAHTMRFARNSNSYKNIAC